MKKKVILILFFIFILLDLKVFADNCFSEDGAFQVKAKIEKKYLISSKNRVLHIGDSHTAGIYGKEIDRLLRTTGAKVETYGSSGSSPFWWFQGIVTKSGFYSKDENENTYDPTDWKTPHPTPDFRELVNKFKPDIIIISLGANLIKASDEFILQDCRKIIEVAVESKARIIWVGPPNGREDKKPMEVQNHLYDILQKAVTPYADFIDSRPFTEYPKEGGDGVHYGGKFGTETAKKWAGNVFEKIQSLSRK